MWQFQLAAAMWRIQPAQQLEGPSQPTEQVAALRIQPMWRFPPTPRLELSHRRRHLVNLAIQMSRKIPLICCAKMALILTLISILATCHHELKFYYAQSILWLSVDQYNGFISVYIVCSVFLSDLTMLPIVIKFLAALCKASCHQSTDLKKFFFKASCSWKLFSSRLKKIMETFF